VATTTAPVLPDDIHTRGDVALEEPISGREALVRGPHDFHAVTEMVCKFNELDLVKTPKPFLGGLALAGALAAMFGGYIGWLVWEGPGIWGNNNPVSWAWDIVNFVFWVGIGHAGTLISAILYLFRQQWRTSINRYAEAMTISRSSAPRPAWRCTPAACGWTTTCSRCPTRWGCGPTSAARWSGTCSR